jgi:DNA-directed RNA polymerase subunit L
MGGSGGGGRGLTYGEEEALERAARESLRRAAEPEKRNVFISFAKEDENKVNLLRGQAKKEESDLEFNDYSIKEPFESKNAEYIKRGIREKIKQCSVTIVYLSNDSAASRWVDWEIRESVKLEKGVVGIYQGDDPPSSLPSVIKELGIDVVPWNHKAVTKAIAKAAKRRG